MARPKRDGPPMEWEDWYLLAMHYFQEHGDLLIPKDYVCPTGERLGRWIERQRAKYNRVPTMRGRLDAVQIEYLEQIGMVWKLETRRSLDEWLPMLDRYRAEHGNVDVPHEYVVDGCGLGDWLLKERQRYAAGELDEFEIAELEARGMNWNLRTRPRSWEEWFSDAEAYYKEHGDLMVQLDYLTANGDKLGFWIYKQRDIYMGRKKGQALTDDRIDRLNRIGMVWAPQASRQDDWDRMYRWVADYKAKNGKLPLWPRDIKAPDGRSVSGWIRTQRQALSDGKVSAERTALLSEIGIFPFKKKESGEAADKK